MKISFNYSTALCSAVKNPFAKAGDVGSVPDLGRSSREGNGNPLQYPFLENLIDTEACL